LIARREPLLERVEAGAECRDPLAVGAAVAPTRSEERTGERINVERRKELMATGADTIAVACPFCMTMLGDAGKKLESDVPVLDIAEVVAQRLAPD